MWKLLAEGKETKLCFNHDLLRVTIEQYSSVVFTDANSLDIELDVYAVFLNISTCRLPLDILADIS